MFRLIALLLLIQAPVWAEPSEAGHGVLANFRQGAKGDVLVLPNFAFYAGKADAPTAFLQPGSWEAEFAGFIAVELRAQFVFQVLVSGTAELLVNGVSVLQFSGANEISPASKPVRLNRGTNAVVVHFTSNSSSDARLQVLWMPKNVATAIPVPNSVLLFAPTAELRKASELRKGLHLFREYRCGACHSGGEVAGFGAPDLDEIGGRLNSGWVAEWIADPRRARGGPHMPQVLREDSGDAANDIAAYLNSLDAPPLGGASYKENGEEIFSRLNCAACHEKEDRFLAEVKRKFKPGALATHLANPQAHYPANPMPNFKLSRDEAEALAAFLEKSATAVSSSAAAGSAEKGKLLIQTSGCLNCHKLPLENRFSAPAVASIARAGLKGCLGREKSGRAPRFALSDEEKSSLAAYLAQSGSQSAKLPAYEVALREVETLRCAACHDRVEGLPRLQSFGGKLQPEWAERFIRGEVPYKPRPWLAARMPAFPAFARSLAAGLAALHGNAPETAPEPAVDRSAAQTGAKLVSAAGGFACVACHAIGSFVSGQVVESPGVNLAYSGERLLKPFFHRWVMNPQAIDPATKMPGYFDAQGRSQLTEILDGDGARQIEAIWQYVRLGTNMPAPPVP